MADRVAALYPDLVTISIYSTVREVHDEITEARIIRDAQLGGS
jgi:hypothetical protein